MLAPLPPAADLGPGAGCNQNQGASPGKWLQWFQRAHGHQAEQGTKGGFEEVTAGSPPSGVLPRAEQFVFETLGEQGEALILFWDHH